MQVQNATLESNMSMPVERHLFDEAFQVTDIVDYGVRFDDLISGECMPPPQGARFDIYYEGSIDGDRLKGYLKGVDYMVVRADGRFQLNIHARIITDDGEPIAVKSTALLRAPDSSNALAPVRLTMEFSTASPGYAWVNDLLAWGTGTVNMETREISVSMYES